MVSIATAASAPSARRRELRELGHYRILEKIGAGGMGEVYKAEDRKLRRTVALKVLPPAVRRDEDARRRFLREARSAALLNHPNIVVIHAIEEADGLDFIVMEYVAGETLAARLARGRLETSELFDVGLQLCDALAAAHAFGIVHRDVKPSNVLVTSRGQVKLHDFGLAKPFRPTLVESAPHLTREGTTVGTFLYMSPEQSRGEPLDDRTDVFSLGSVLYEAATGREPFQGPSALAVMHAIATQEPPAPSQLRDDLPSGYDRVIARAMAKDKRGRFASAAEFGDALRTLRDSPGEGEAARPAEGAGSAARVRESSSSRDATALRIQFCVTPGGQRIAYSVLGNGPALVCPSWWVSHLELDWEDPLYREFFIRLAARNTVVRYDRLGVGLSDRTRVDFSPESEVADLTALIEHLGFSRVGLVGLSCGGPPAITYAVRFPERVTGLVLYGSFSCGQEMLPPETQAALVALVRSYWGLGAKAIVDLLVPDLSAEDRKAFGRVQRASASADMAAQLLELIFALDVRDLVDRLRVPTLVLHRRDDRTVLFDLGRKLAGHIAGAEFTPLGGKAHRPWHGDVDGLLDAMAAFLAKLPS
jgi:pimeloyl-ACP methyl ester carboxylesterase